MSTSQAPTGSNEDERRKGAMGKEIEVEDLGNKSAYNSLSSSESSDEEIDATASKEMRRLAKRMAKNKTDKIMKNMETMEKVMIDMMRKMEKQETSSSSPKKSNSTKQQEYTRNSFDYSKMQGNVSSNFILVPLGKAPLLDGLNYADWVNKMKLQLITLHLSLWEVANVGVCMLRATMKCHPR